MAKTYNVLDDGWIKAVNKRKQNLKKTTGGAGIDPAYKKRVKDIAFEKHYARQDIASKHKTDTAQSGTGIKNTLRYAVAQSVLRKQAKLNKRTSPILSTQGTPPKKTWSVPTDRYKIVAPVINRKK